MRKLNLNVHDIDALDEIYQFPPSLFRFGISTCFLIVFSQCYFYLLIPNVCFVSIAYTKKLKCDRRFMNTIRLGNFFLMEAFVNLNNSQMSNELHG
jgi:hypothetical protein